MKFQVSVCASMSNYLRWHVIAFLFNGEDVHTQEYKRLFDVANI